MPDVGNLTGFFGDLPLIGFYTLRSWYHMSAGLRAGGGGDRMNGTMSHRELEEAVRSSDRDTLESVVMSLADMFGAASVARAFGEVGDGISGTRAGAIAERTESALYVDGDALRGMGGTDEYGDPVDPEEYATDMMRQCLRDEFEDEVWELVRKGRNTEACDVIRRIARGSAGRTAPSSEVRPDRRRWCTTWTGAPTTASRWRGSPDPGHTTRINQVAKMNH